MGGVIRESFKVPQCHTEFTVDIGPTTAMNTGKSPAFGGCPHRLVRTCAPESGQVVPGLRATLPEAAGERSQPAADAAGSAASAGTGREKRVPARRRGATSTGTAS